MAEETLSRPPTFMRYQRVEQVLESEPRFKAQMTSKSEAVLKPNGEKQLFAPVVIQVTEAIHAQGQDAHKAQRMDIIRVAMDFFRPGRTQPERAETTPTPATVGTREIAPPVPPTPAKAPAPAAKRPAPAAATNGAPVQPKRPSPAKRPVAGGSAKPAEPKPEPAAPAPAANGEPKGHAAPPATAPRNEATARPAAARSVDGEEVRAPEGRRTSTSDPAYNPYISIFSLLLQAAECIDKLDTQPGKDKRLKTLEDLAVEYRKFTGIPRNA